MATDKFIEGDPTDEDRAAVLDYNDTVQRLNRGNIFQEMTKTEIEAARTAEIAAGKTFRAIIYNTDSECWEAWGNTGGGQPLPW